MHEKSSIYSSLKYLAGSLSGLVIISFLFVSPLKAQEQKPNLPDPVKFVNKFDIVWNVVHAVLDEMQLRVELEDRKAGRMVTRPSEFITGALTPNEVDRVAIRKDTVTGNWLKAQYSVEALLEIVTPTETMVTIHAKVEALNRDVSGTEKWVPMESLGVFERRILGKISMKLMGNELPGKKGFWNKSPQPINPLPSRIPKPPG